MTPTNGPIETVFEQELPAQEVAKLAAKSPSFHFLADPAEDLYSLHDGQPL